MQDASTERKTVTVVAIIIAILSIVLVLIFFPYIMHVLQPLYSKEEMVITISPERTGQYSIWLPLLSGSPFASASKLSGPEAVVILVQDQKGLFLNFTTSGNITIKRSSGSSGTLNESYLDYEWTGKAYDQLNQTQNMAWAKAFASGNVTVSIHFDASSNYCSRHDDVEGILPGNSAWTAIKVWREAVCQ